MSVSLTFLHIDLLCAPGLTGVLHALAVYRKDRAGCEERPRLAADVTLNIARNDPKSQHVCARTEDRRELAEPKAPVTRHLRYWRREHQPRKAQESRSQGSAESAGLWVPTPLRVSDVLLKVDQVYDEALWYFLTLEPKALST